MSTEQEWTEAVSDHCVLGVFSMQCRYVRQSELACVLCLLAGYAPAEEVSDTPWSSHFPSFCVMESLPSWEPE